MNLFSFDVQLTYNEANHLLSSTLVPKFGAKTLTHKTVLAALNDANYGDFYIFESTIEEFVTQSDTLVEKGQRLYHEYINKLNEKHQSGLVDESSGELSNEERSNEKQPIDEDSNAGGLSKDELDAQALDAQDTDTQPEDALDQDSSSEVSTSQALTSQDNSENENAEENEQVSAENNVSPEQVLAMLGEQTLSFDIAECRDALISFDLSEDDLQAHISIERPYGGDIANNESILSALANKGIEFGIDYDAIEKALEYDKCQDILIATGIKPKKGRDSRFEALVSEQISSGPKIDSKGRANYHDINEFVIVAPGDKLMQRTLPGKGKPGTDVFGKVIPALPGEILPFSGDTTGSTVSEDNKNLLLATEKGHPVIKDRGVSVENVLMLNNVGLSTGNVDFDGSVCVNEDVADGVKIEATGDVTVKGVVGKATIIAGGNIVILQGLLGGSKAVQDPTEEPYGAHLTSKGSVSAHFVTRSKIRAAKKIVVAEYASHSDLYADEQILVGQETGKGNLFGGYARAFKLVAAKVIGSTGGTPTQIQVGAEGDNIVKLRKIGQAKRLNDENTYDVNEALHKIRLLAQSAGMTPQMKEKAEKLNTKLGKLQDELKVLKDKEEVVKLILVKSKKSRVIANYQIYNNTSVSILGSSKKITEETKGGTFKFDARKVVLER